MASSSTDMSQQLIQRKTSLRTNLLRGFMNRLSLRSPDNPPDNDGRGRRQHAPLPNAAALPVCFAVDVSGSTEGIVLRAEQDAITAISSALNNNTQYAISKSSILPWDDKAHVRLPLKDANDLISDGGTAPSAILYDAQYRRCLQEAGLWVLMTDGQIDQFNVRSFANSIPEAGLHGTACVIIAFGNRGWSPFQCDVSVGISVFAVAPHCLFLYHAIQGDKLYVIQAKGCFKELLPMEKRFIVFNSSTRWDDLHSISYEDLAKIQVPQPVKLSRDSVVLPNGKIFDMRSIYENKVSIDDKLELLSDPASLDVILLAANTRGTGYLIESWLGAIRKKQGFAASEALGREKDVEREDIGGMGLIQLTTLIAHVTNPTDTDTFWEVLRSKCVSRNPALERLKSNLRHRHQLNWTNVQLSINARYQVMSKMIKNVDGILSTISRIESGMCAPSPAMLTPMSSLPPNMEQDVPSGHSIGFVDEQKDWSSLSCSVGPSLTDHLTPFTNEVSPVLGTYDEPSPVVDISTITFFPEFKTRDISGLHGFNLDHPPAYDTCLLCGRTGSIQTLLLQSISTTEPTHSLPSPDSLSGHKYPLVLGNYPETDVVIPLVTCDGCAFLFQQAKKIPNCGGLVTGCLPLVPLNIIENRTKWIEILSEVYEHRFSDDITLLVFLSTLSSTLEDISEYNDGGVQVVQEWFEWACSEILSLPGLPTLAGLPPAQNDLSFRVKPSMTIKDALGMAFSASGSKTVIIETPFLEYPIHGFVVLVKLAELLKELEASRIELLVWKRLCCYLIEQHAEMQSNLGVNVANKRLHDFLFDPSAVHCILIPETASSARSACTVANLLDTHLFNHDVLDQFRRVSTFFDAIESHKSSFKYSLAVILHLLNDFVKKESIIRNPGFCFRELQYQMEEFEFKNDYNEGLETPALVSEEKASFVISQIYKPSRMTPTTLDIDSSYRNQCIN